MRSQRAGHDGETEHAHAYIYIYICFYEDCEKEFDCNLLKKLYTKT